MTPERADEADDTPDDIERKVISFTERAQILAKDPSGFAEAALLLKQAVQLCPDQEEVIINYVGFCTEVGTYYLNKDEFDEAIVFFERALVLSPNDAQTLLDIGTAYAHTNRVLDALRAWRMALDNLDEKIEGNVEEIQAIAENLAIVANALNVQIRVSAKAGKIREDIDQLMSVLRDL